MIANGRVTEFRFQRGARFWGANLLELFDQEVPAGGKLGVFSELDKKEYALVEWNFRTPRHNGVTNKKEGW